MLFSQSHIPILFHVVWILCQRPPTAATAHIVGVVVVECADPAPEDGAVVVVLVAKVVEGAEGAGAVVGLEVVQQAATVEALEIIDKSMTYLYNCLYLKNYII